MEHNKAPGPDGFPAEFYQNFWDVIKFDLLAFFVDLHAGQLELFRLNFGEIILLPKVNETERSNNTIIFVFLTSALKYSLRWPRSGSTRWLIM
jgi:hypothetical protein